VSAENLNQVSAIVEQLDGVGLAIPVHFRDSTSLDASPYIVGMVSRRTTPKASRQNCRWRVFYLKGSPARDLGSIEAPDDPAAAHAKAVEVFRIEPERRRKVMVLRAD
jgi:hypothetical protein